MSVRVSERCRERLSVTRFRYFVKGLGDKVSFESSPNILLFFGLFRKMSYFK